LQNLNILDYIVIVVYFAILIGFGFVLRKRASQNLEEYLLGGRRLPWWVLGVSGMAAFLDMTGTMIIVSFLYMLGPRGLFIEFRGGAVLVLAFWMLWAGKWHRRSGCMTGAEWMAFRFGDGIGGQLARIARVISAVGLTVGMLAYLIKGLGLFMAMFLPFSPLTCSLIMIAIAALYTIVSGFYVVFSDMFQSAVVLIGVMVIASMAFMKIPDLQSLSVLAKEITGNSDWIKTGLQVHTTMPKGYEAYSNLAMFAMFYLLRNVIAGMGMGDDPRYFGAKNDRECGKLSFLWTSLMVIRWPMMMGFAVLGIYLIKDIFPDQSVLFQASEIIKQHFTTVDKSRWTDVLAGIVQNQGQYPDVVAGLKNLLGDDWTTKINLLSYEGTVNPERILPAVILYQIPMGLRGLMLIALIAAALTTFDSQVNMTIGFLTKDIYQRYLRKIASNKELIYASWGFGILLTVIGFIMAFSTKSINDIWGWIIMGLTGGFLIPSFLRLYWWRLNGAGFAIGTIIGITSAVIQRIMFPALDERWQFLSINTISLIATVAGTYLTKPTDKSILENFYKKTRPFGLWGPLKGVLSAEETKKMKKEHFYDIISVPFALLWQVTLFMLPMQLVIKSYGAFWKTFIIFAGCLVALYFLWYRHLPAENEE